MRINISIFKQCVKVAIANMSKELKETILRGKGKYDVHALSIENINNDIKNT